MERQGLVDGRAKKAQQRELWLDLKGDDQVRRRSKVLNERLDSTIEGALMQLVDIFVDITEKPSTAIVNSASHLTTGMTELSR